jgi:hypothetical protein
MNQLSSTAPQTTAATPCPRCKQPLVDPHGLGWCKACGYCRSLTESEAAGAQIPDAKAAAQNSLTATGSAIGQTPIWFWVTLAGVVLVAGATFACGRYLTFTPLQRALLASVQIGAGFAIMIVGQFIGLLRIAPEDSALSFKDALFPMRLYGLVFKRLPATRHTLYLGAWGVAAILSAAVFIGGLQHWLTYLPGNQKNQSQIPKVQR